jgi:hypothetical protein
LFRFEAKITKLKRSNKFTAKKSEKNAKKCKKWQKKVKKAKKIDLISLHFVLLRSENYSSEAKRKIWSENKQKKRSEIL